MSTTIHNARPAVDTRTEARNRAFSSGADPRMLMDRDDIRRALIERHSRRTQERLDNAHVGIAGLGGLGSTVAVALARIGVGHLHCIDFDRVDLTNLNRQQYFLKDVGQYKTEAIRANIAQINPYIDVEIDTLQVDEHNIPSLFAHDDIICEAFDVPENKAILVNTVLDRLPDKPLVCASGMAGFASSNLIGTRRVGRRLYYCGDGSTAPLPGAGLMAPRVGVVACHEANMVTRLIMGQDEA